MMLENINLLLVEDDWPVMAALSGVLRSEGCNVLGAGDGAHGLELFRTRRPDIVLLDLNLPVRNGWDTFERMTAIDPLIPIVIMTGRPDQAPVAEAAGASALLEKPFEIPVLLETLRAVLAETPEMRLGRLADRRPMRRARAPLAGHEVL